MKIDFKEIGVNRMNMSIYRRFCVIWSKSNVDMFSDSRD